MLKRLVESLDGLSGQGSLEDGALKRPQSCEHHHWLVAATNHKLGGRAGFQGFGNVIHKFLVYAQVQGFTYQCAADCPNRQASQREEHATQQQAKQSTSDRTRFYACI